MMQVYNVVAADAPRAGSAEAKNQFSLALAFRIMMHPVQAAPRQRTSSKPDTTRRTDAPRAGNAEAKKRQNGALVTRA